MSADASWAAAPSSRPGYPTDQAGLIAELDAENARLHGELIDAQCELATARAQIARATRVLSVFLTAVRRTG